MAKKKRFRKSKMATAWYDYELADAFTQTAGVDSMHLLCKGSDIYPAAAAGLDFGRKDWVKILKIICRILLVLTSTGAEQYLKILWGMRIAELEDDETLPTSSGCPSLDLATSNDRKVDWIWRDSSVAYVPATSGSDVALTYDQHPGLRMNFKPNRPIPQRHALVLHVRVVTLSSLATNDDTVKTMGVDGRILLGRPKAF